MRYKSINQKNFRIYIVLSFILLLAVLAFYLSCKSKSPTEPSMSSNETLAAQGVNGTNRTTTTSSKTTTTRPVNASNNTTTLITSRTLTTTSIRTTTTTIPLTTTTSRRSDTTSIATAELQWCPMEIITIGMGAPLYINNGDTIETGPLPPIPLIFIPSLKNVGESPITNVRVTLRIRGSGIYGMINPSVVFSRIPATGRCKKFKWSMPGTQLSRLSNNDGFADFSMPSLVVPPDFPIAAYVGLAPGQRLTFRFTENYSNKQFVFTFKAGTVVN